MDGKAMRNMDYKLIRFDYGGEELYHLTTDPTEHLNLLLDMLSPEAATNYIYLCNQMSNLVGSVSFCTPGVGVEYINQPKTSMAFPNPFSQYLQLNSQEQEITYQLSNATGLLFYQGKDLEKQCFSELPPGMYFLHGSDGKIQKLIKQ